MCVLEQPIASNPEKYSHLLTVNQKITIRNHSSRIVIPQDSLHIFIHVMRVLDVRLLFAKLLLLT